MILLWSRRSVSLCGLYLASTHSWTLFYKLSPLASPKIFAPRELGNSTFVLIHRRYLGEVQNLGRLVQRQIYGCNILGYLPSKLALTRDSVKLFGGTFVSLWMAQLINTWVGCLLSCLARATIQDRQLLLDDWICWSRRLYASARIFSILSIPSTTNRNLRAYHLLEPL